MGLGSLVGKASHTLFSLYAHFAMHTCLYVYEEKLKACMGKCPSMACFISIGIHSVRLMYLPGSSRGALIGVPCEECLFLFRRWGRHTMTYTEPYQPSQLLSGLPIRPSKPSCPTVLGALILPLSSP